MCIMTEIQVNPPGFVPSFGQGIQAKENQEGVEGGKIWLKSLKLHKYWPVFSNWTYNEIMALTEDNIDEMVEKVGAESITTGAKRKLVRCVSTLKEREDILHSLPDNLLSQKISIQEALGYLETVIQTPLPTSPSEILPSAIIYCTTQVYLYIINNSLPEGIQRRFQNLLSALDASPILRFTTEKLLLCLEMEDISNKKGTPEMFEENLVGADKSIDEHKTPRQRMSTNDSGFEDFDWWPVVSDESESIWPIEENTVMFEKWPKSLLIDDLSATFRDSSYVKLNYCFEDNRSDKGGICEEVQFNEGVCNKKKVNYENSQGLQTPSMSNHERNSDKTKVKVETGARPKNKTYEKMNTSNTFIRNPNRKKECSKLKNDFTTSFTNNSFIDFTHTSDDNEYFANRINSPNNNSLNYKSTINDRYSYMTHGRSWNYFPCEVATYFYISPFSLNRFCPNSYTLFNNDMYSTFELWANLLYSP